MGRAGGGTLQGLGGVLVPCWAAVPAPRPVPSVSCPGAGLLQRREVDVDARARLGQTTAHQQGGGSAMEASTRQLLAWHGGARRPTRAEPLGAQRPPATGSTE